MKTSHYKTPRTLAECEFTVGYPIAEPDKPRDLRPFAFAAVCILVLLWAFK